MTAAEQQNKPFRYYAFISYRHADNKVSGRQWATWLHQSIENYEIPKDLVGTQNDRGETIPEKIFPIFRDEEELPIDANLDNAIQRALDNSYLLIVLCSPGARASKYVAEEIDYFKQHRNRHNVLAAIIDGEPNVSCDENKQESGFSIKDECFPKPLQYEYDQEGHRTQIRSEPLAADFRINIEGKSRQAWTSSQALKDDLQQEGKLSTEQIKTLVTKYNQQQRLMLLKIIAGILGIPLGKLTKRDQEYQLQQERQKAKRLRQWLSGVAALCLLSVLLGIFSWIQRNEAVEMRNASLQNQGNYLMAEADKRVGTGENTLALLLGLNALPGKYGGERPDPTDLAPLYRAIVSAVQPELIFPHEHAVDHAYIVDDNTKLITADRDGIIRTWSIESGELLHSEDQYKPVMDIVFSPDKSLYAVTTYGHYVEVLYTSSGQSKRSIKVHRSDYAIVDSVAFSEDGRFLYIGWSRLGTGYVSVWDIEAGKAIKEVEFDDSIKSLKIASDFKSLLISFYNDSFRQLALPDLVLKNQVKISESDSYYSSMVNNGENIVLFSYYSAFNLYSSADGENVFSDGTRSFSGESRYHDIKVTPDFSKALVNYGSNVASVWNIASGEKLHQLKHDGEITHASLSEDGRFALTSSSDKTVKVWDLQTGEVIQNVQHNDEATQATFSASGDAFATVSKDNNVAVWQLNIGDSKQLAFEEDISQMTTDGTGRYLLSVLPHSVVISDLQGVLVEKQLPFDAEVRKAGFCSDNGEFFVHLENYSSKIFQITQASSNIETALSATHITSGTPYYTTDCYTYIVRDSSETIGLYDGNASTPQTKLNHDYRITDFEIANGGKNLVSVDVDWESRIVTEESVTNINSQITVWDLITGQPIQRFPVQDSWETDVSSAHLSGDNVILTQFVGSHIKHQGEVEVYSAKTGDFRFNLIKKRYLSLNRIKSIAVSPTEDTLVTATRFLDSGNNKGETIFWSLKTGEELFSLDTKAQMDKLQFSPDGNILITQSYKTIELWWVPTRQQLQTINTEGEFTSFFVTPDNTKLLVLESGKVNVISMIPVGQLAEAAADALPKNKTCLSEEERKQFFLLGLTEEQRKVRGCHY